MKKNYSTCILGSKIILVPYRPEHIPTYHKWMQSPFLLQMTASEPLSIEEEIKMQEEWYNDDNKCTFIVLVKYTCCSNSVICQDFIKSVMEDKQKGSSDHHDGSDNCEESKFDFINETLDAMIGDVNLFLSEIDMNDDDDDDGGDGDSTHNLETKSNTNNNEGGIQAELDIMIAEENYRRQGMGKEATLLMMIYGAQNLNIRRFIVKINEDNDASMQMFKTLGFRVCNYAECFREYELELCFDRCEEMIEAVKKLYQSKVYEWKLP